MKESKHLVTIDDTLRFLLFGLQNMLHIEFSGKLVEQIFLDSEYDQVSEKKYNLYDNSNVSVVGFVENYEPESIWIIVKGKFINLENLVERSQYEVYRMKMAKERKNSKNK